jgi:hypothetical protein
VDNSSLCVSNESDAIGIIWDLGERIVFFFQNKLFHCNFTDSIDGNSFNTSKKGSSWVLAWNITGFSILPAYNLYWNFYQEWQGNLYEIFSMPQFYDVFGYIFLINFCQICL